MNFKGSGSGNRFSLQIQASLLACRSSLGTSLVGGTRRDPWIRRLSSFYLWLNDYTCQCSKQALSPWHALRILLILPFRPERSPCLHPCFWEELQISRVGEEASFHRTPFLSPPLYLKQNKSQISNTKFWEIEFGVKPTGLYMENNWEIHVKFLYNLRTPWQRDDSTYGPGGAPYNGLYGRALSFSGFSYMKG